MKTLTEIAHAITSPYVLDELTDLLRIHDNDFAAEEESYKNAVSALKSCLSDDAAIDAYIHSHQIEVIGNILYAAYESYRVNLNNFHSPYTTMFVCMDFTNYIRDHLIGYFQPILEARQKYAEFEKSVPEYCRDAVDIVKSYFIMLDVTAPKLAHYYGYMIANAILPWVVPGYRADLHQTLEYKQELENCLGYLPA